MSARIIAWPGHQVADEAAPAARGGPGWRAWPREAWRRLRTRRILAELDAATLRDIGLTVAEARIEAEKPFWRR